MDTEIETLTNKRIENDNFKFIKLKGKNFAKYQIIYHINDCYKIKDLSSFRLKHQLLFQKFKSRELQMNLLYIDSVFPILLAELALSVFLDNIGSFDDFLKSEKLLRIIPEENEWYCRYKISDFIKYLIYSDISKRTYSKGKIDSSRIFCLKNEFGISHFCTIYDQHKLIEILFHTMKFEIDLKSSSISKNKVNLCLKIFMD